jgi:hypothetical protein
VTDTWPVKTGAVISRIHFTLYKNQVRTLKVIDDDDDDDYDDDMMMMIMMINSG